MFDNCVTKGDFSSDLSLFPILLASTHWVVGQVTSSAKMQQVWVEWRLRCLVPWQWAVSDRWSRSEVQPVLPTRTTFLAFKIHNFHDRKKRVNLSVSRGNQHYLSRQTGDRSSNMIYVYGCSRWKAQVLFSRRSQWRTFKLYLWRQNHFLQRVWCYSSVCRKLQNKKRVTAW